MTDDLLPRLEACPMCGGKAVAHEGSRFDWHVFCDTCDVQTPRMATREGAVSLWNTRPTPAPSIFELAPSTEGRVEIGPNDPLYKAFRPSPETIAAIEKHEQANAQALTAIRDMMFGHVTNWPEPKKFGTAIALIDKTLHAALGPKPALGDELVERVAIARDRLEYAAGQFHNVQQWYEEPSPDGTGTLFDWVCAASHIPDTEVITPEIDRALNNALLASTKIVAPDTEVPDEISDKLDAWLRNLDLELSGASLSRLYSVTIGGAVLTIADLRTLLQWFADQIERGAFKGAGNDLHG